MKIILRADDLGISEGVNYGIFKAVYDGMVSCVGLMPNMESARHGYDLIKDLDICLGQHTNICLGKPVSDPLKIPSLVNENGEFYISREINHRQQDTVDILECELEIEAQLQRFIEITGKKPEYFEGHAVFSKNYFQALKNVAKRYHLFYDHPMDENWQKQYHIQSLDYFSLDDRGLYDPYQYFESQLPNIQKNECSLVVFHPGFLDQYILKHSSYTLIRPMECAFLCSQWLKDWLLKHHIEIVDFRNYQKE
ncbi:ChbG/HpnK family deacetylase [Allocoprobacillus halotolerans]|uniref:ChbG/HpnK family deacetylase n=1 Tax=Allocoprobacillus halotolerans TaxID=2944914 RepID=A0ABY5HY40_9FIRM|nr:ChbG/HpnK family deacetylase [Allocoprobacillus halotolerans]UTY37984.1 ChbG/HpnK family deacetylase [Allocoprobacillus halotolerans]